MLKPSIFVWKKGYLSEIAIKKYELAQPDSIDRASYRWSRREDLLILREFFSKHSDKFPNI